jgi:hypothetical protein
MEKLAATPIGMLSVNSNIMHPKIVAGELAPFYRGLRYKLVNLAW